MGFESVLGKRVGGRGFGQSRYLATGKERPHISRSKLLANDSTEFVGLGEEKKGSYMGWMGRRYIAAENLTYDFIITFYDVNSPYLSVVRLFEAERLMKSLKRALKDDASSRPNIEARIIGLQNGQEHGFLSEALDLLSKRGVRLIEADLFGGDVRHIAIDLKTGASYNVLLEDRSYRPGELMNHMTLEDFRRPLLRAKK